MIILNSLQAKADHALSGKSDKFSEKLQTAFDPPSPPPSFLETMLRFNI